MFTLRKSFPLICLMLAACGTTPEERGLSGAGIGASAGAVLGAVTGLSVLQGAVIGAAAGGLTGALTDENQVNLGDPLWKRGSSGGTSGGHAAYHQTPPAQTVRTIQSGLSRLGYQPGAVDGVAGSRTRTAIQRYQEDHGLLVDGMPTPTLASHIQQQL